MANLDLKQLSKVIDLCRKKGVESIEIDGIKIVLGAQVERPKRSKQIDPEETIETSQFSEEETLFWSSGGLLPMEGVG